MKRLFKEPLLHFLLLGAGIFAAYSLLSSRVRDEPGKIVITQARIENLAVGFARTWQRPPSHDELAGLIRDQIREEIYYREAMALGLDKDDTVIRRRLRQKMEFVSDDIATEADPTDADLNAYLTAHPDSFRIEPRFMFRQVYLDPQKHGDSLGRDAARLLAQLNQAGDKADISTLGDASLLEQVFDAVTSSDIARQFGTTFAARLGGVPSGRWQGPIESGYGPHLVKISKRTDGGLPALAEVRDAVRREWQNARRTEANEKFYQELQKRYVVTIEQPRLAKSQ